MKIRQELREKFSNGQLSAEEIQSHIYTVPLIHPDICQELVKAHRNYYQDKIETIATDNFVSKGMLPLSNNTKDILNLYINKIMILMIDHYYLEYVYLDFAGVSCIHPGGRPLIPHADNTRWDGQNYVDNHTPRRAYTCIVYLNDNFTGGETVYGRDGHGPVTSIPYSHVVSPTKGYANFHPCGEFYHHCVDVVIGSPRYALVAWFAVRDPSSGRGF